MIFDRIGSLRLRRRGLVLTGLGACLLASAIAAVTAYAHKETGIDPVELEVTPLKLNSEDPGQDQVGRLVWRGGLEFTSDDERLGGLSGILVSAEGDEMLAVSDKGRWFSAHIIYDAAGRLAGLDDGRIARMRDLDGGVLKKKAWRDAEALAALHDGTRLVSFEREHRIWQYGVPTDGLDATPIAWPGPADFGDIPENNGLEALVVLEDGGLLALAQHEDEGGGSIAFLGRKGGWSRLIYVHDEGFDPKGAARLPGGDIVVLETGRLESKERVVRLVRVAASSVRPNAHLEGRELARWQAPVIVAAFEGVAAREGPGGETLIYLLSDDDFDDDEATRLLMFELLDQGQAD